MLVLGSILVALGGCLVDNWQDDDLGPGQTLCGSERVRTDTDVDHCGGCFQACPAGPGATSWCASGRCYAAERRAVAEDGAVRLLVTASDVYWTSRCEGVITGVEKGGGVPLPVAVDQFAIQALAADDTRLYWAMACPGGVDSCCASPTQVGSIPLVGGQPAPLAAAGTSPAIALTTRGDAVFWTVAPMKVPHGQYVLALTIRDGYLYWINRGGGAGPERRAALG